MQTGSCGATARARRIAPFARDAHRHFREESTSIRTACLGTLTLLSTTLATTVVAQQNPFPPNTPFGNESGCRLALHDTFTNMEFVIIRDNVVQFSESSCDIQSVELHGDGRVTLQTYCIGMGEEYEDAMSLRPVGGGAWVFDTLDTPDWVVRPC